MLKNGKNTPDISLVNMQSKRAMLLQNIESGIFVRVFINVEVFSRRNMKLRKDPRAIC